MTKIVLVSDMTFGGAGIACRRLFDGLRKQGRHNISWVAAMGDSRQGAVIASSWPALPTLILYRLVARFFPSSIAAMRFDQALNEANVLQIVRKMFPDIIHLHNLHEGMSFSLVERLPAAIPIVWSLHDMWPLTGHCSYSYDCRKYMDGCMGTCPSDGGAGSPEILPQDEWHRLQRFFERNKGRMIFTSPSRWLTELARARLGEGFRVEYVPHSLDLRVFRPLGDKMAIRRLLGFPEHKKVILVGAQCLDDRRKGGELFAEAMDRLPNDIKGSVMVVAFGAGKKNKTSDVEYRFAGSIHDEALLNLYFNAADVFVLPSRADNLPNTLLEAVAAGTPCVTSDVGGCPEVVRNGETGFVVKQGVAQDLSEHILRVLCMPGEEWLKMSQNCRGVAEREYAFDLQATRMETLYGQVQGCWTQ